MIQLDRNDKQFFVGAIIAPLIVWWLFVGRQKYSTKGMK
jgi:hypothetical protein